MGGNRTHVRSRRRGDRGGAGHEDRQRASWSPDGQRIAFMSKSFGDAFVVDVRTRMIRLLTHYQNPAISGCNTCPTAISS
jgi:hypothetical protein